MLWVAAVRGVAAQPESYFRLECRRNARTAEQLRPSLVTRFGFQAVDDGWFDPALGAHL